MSELLKCLKGTRNHGVVLVQGKLNIVASVKAFLAIQDITYTAVAEGTAGEVITIEYVDGATAGAEVVTVTGNAISIEIEDGVSTATQVKAAYDAEAEAVALATAAITGTAGDAQVEAAEAPLDGGVNGVASTDMNGLASATKTGTGLYKITLTKAYTKLLAANAAILASSVVAQVPQFKSEDVNGTKEIEIVYHNGTSATNPTVTHELHLSFLVSDSYLEA